MIQAWSDIKNAKFPEQLFLLGWLILAIGASTSRTLMTISVITIGVAWILQWNWRDKYQRWKSKPVIGWIQLLYVVHVIGLIWTEDMGYGSKELSGKLPILLIPLFAGTFRITISAFKEIVFKIFVLTLVVSISMNLIEYLKYQWDFYDSPLLDIREISLFISHIRLSLLLSTAIICLGLNGKKWAFHSWINKGLIIYFLSYLVFTQSMTGLITTLLVGVVLVLYKFYKHSFRRLFIGIFAVFGILFCLGFYLKGIWNNVTEIKGSDLNVAKRYNEQGDKLNSENRKDVENGYYVWKNYNEESMRKAWNQRSSIKYDSLDLKGNRLRGTLIRFLTSKGQIKDGLAVNQLNQQEVSQIEQGIPNHLYADMSNIERRIRETLYEVYMYQNDFGSNGHSVTLRLTYAEIGWNIFKDNPWLGIGTGDVKQAFKSYYQENDTGLLPSSQKRTHNQFITFLLTFGIVGFAIIVWGWMKTVAYFQSTPWMLGFFAVFFLSCLTEDTLETQAGVTFYVLFLGLGLMGSVKST